MSKNVLVAGINGFVGKHLARELQMSGFKVYGTGTDTSIDKELAGVVTAYYECDLTDPDSIKNLVLEKFNSIVNLAGLARPSTSFGKEDLYNKVNVEVHTVLLEAIKVRNLPIRVIVVSTGAVYDNEQGMPLTEKSSLLKKGSPYALSKKAMEKALQEYRKMGLDIIVARPFNHIGPGQKEGFLLPDLAKQLRESDTITAGNIETSRDYTDVRDVVKAYVLLASTNNLSSNVYNICSGIPIRGSELLAMLAKKMGKKNYKTIIDKARLRPDDPAEIYGSYALIKKDTGWQPSIKLEQTIADFVDAL